MSNFHANIHEGEYVSATRSKLPLSHEATISEAKIHSPRASTPIRLNSPHMSMAELAIVNNNILSSLNLHQSDSHPQYPSPHPLHSKNNDNAAVSTSPTPQFSNFDNGQDFSISSPPFLPSTPNSVDVDGMPVSIPANLPKLVHKWTHTHSILCCIASPAHNLLFCGTQDGKVLIFDMLTYSLKHEIDRSENPHQNSSILTICVNKKEDTLFVAGSDSLVKVYDFKTGFQCTHIIYSLVDIDDIFSLAWCDNSQTLIIGAQNASILWCKLFVANGNTRRVNLENLPHFRYDKFFDSKGPGGSQNTLQTRHELMRKNSRNSTPVDESKHVVSFIECRQQDIVRFAHNGYVYCLDIVDTTIGHFGDGKFLISGGGDGVVNIWKMKHYELHKEASLQNDESVLSMTIQGSLLYVGLGDSCINVWDLLTLQMIRSFVFNKEGMNEVLSLGVYKDALYKACSGTGLVKLTMKHKNVADSVFMSSDQEDGVINTVSTFKLHHQAYLLAGGNKSLTLWNISEDDDSADDFMQGSGSTVATLPTLQKGIRLDDNDLLSMLKKFISYKTISKNPQLYLEDSRHCAKFLSRLLTKFGSYQTNLLPVEDGNPIVFAEFKRNSPLPSTKHERVLYYGHYDVVDATNHEARDWSTNPFVLTPKDGSLYARGVSDNKGPTLAAIYAVADLYNRQELGCDVVFIIEGEEECGSTGFQAVIQQHKSLIGEIDWILLSNSYWLDDVTPCLNYGLRGLINANVIIKSDKPDRHSGVDGGVSREPVMDMMQILTTLIDPVTQKIQIDGFYDDLLPLGELEQALYNEIKNKFQESVDINVLQAKWRQPSLTVHKIQVSGPNNNTVIPQLVNATISMRIVANQNLTTIKRKLIDHLTIAFNNLKSDNHLQINIFHEAEPWLGDPSNKVYLILYKNIQSHWQQDPIFIREGGSIPSIRFLEKCFDAPAAQIPCGQASDNAHLKDEKLRIVNLFKLRQILSDTLKELGEVE